MMRPIGCNTECPACRHIETPYDDSIKTQWQWLNRKLGSFSACLRPMIGVSEAERLGYRNKVMLRTAFIGGRWEPVMIKSKKFIPVSRCPVHAPRVNNSIKFLLESLPPPDIFPLVYYAQSGRQAVFVVKKNPPFDGLPADIFNDSILKKAEIEGLWLHLNLSAGKKVFNKAYWQKVCGTDFSLDEDGMMYGPRSFQQLIRSVYKQSLDKAFSFLRPDADSVVIDLYCGTGYSMKRWAEHGPVIYGVEMSPEAVACARINVPSAGILMGSCVQRLPQLNELIASLPAKVTEKLLYVNPPRTGLEEKVADWISRTFRPGRMAYLSCSAGTLVRDLERITGCGYDLHSITPFDFFPMTHHAECLALLEKRV